MWQASKVNNCKPAKIAFAGIFMRRPSSQIDASNCVSSLPIELTSHKPVFKGKHGATLAAAMAACHDSLAAPGSIGAA
jgi:hypothetical protein